MGKKTSLLCKLWGHSIDPEECAFHGCEICDRCGEQIEIRTGFRDFVKANLWVLKNDIKSAMNGFREWLTCRDCGKHFGRHDESKEHLPF